DDVNLGYRQDAFGGQIGFDIGGGSSENGGAVFGVSTGYLSSAMNFAGSGDRFDIDTLNGAIYGAFQAGGLFINGLARYDRSWIEARGNLANFNVKTKANTWGGKLEAGARLGSDTFFAEPAVSIAYTKSDIDGYGTLGGRFDFDDFEGLRGKAGVKIGGATDIGESSKLVFYV
ncbi:autotransporter domain-containing protein, partial [Sphingomonas sp. ABOLD]